MMVKRKDINKWVKIWGKRNLNVTKCTNSKWWEKHEKSFFLP